MASSKTRIKPIRIANETADYFEGKALNRLVESVHHLLETGKMSFDGEELKISGEKGVYTDKMSVFFKEIESMASFFGITTEEMTGQFFELLNEGVLTVEEGRLVAVKESWVERFEDACHDRCIPVEKAVESVIKGLK